MSIYHRLKVKQENSHKLRIQNAPDFQMGKMAARTGGKFR
jgi:hypothetical protein